MFFPYLDKTSEKSITVSEFSGLNRTEAYRIGELSDMRNMCSDKYPLLTPSAKMDTVQINSEIKNIQGFISHGDNDTEFLGFTGVADGLFYYRDTNIPFAYSFMKIPTDSEVRLVNFADMIIIYPQMYCYEYKNSKKKSKVYPLSPGIYDEYIKVKTTGAYGETITLSKETDTTTWTELGIEVGDSLVFYTEDELYSQLNVHIAKDKYDTDYSSNVVLNALVKSVSDYEMRVDMLNYKGKAIGITDSHYNAINNEFKRTLIVYKRFPIFESACVYANRIWAVEKNGEKICASVPGKPYEFSRFSGLSTDSWYTEVAEGGAFTGICALKDGVVAFKERNIYHIFGDRPTNFNIAKRFSNCGCIDSASVVETDTAVYFTGADGIYEYSGANPQNISKKLGIEKYLSACAFSDGKKYYVSPNGESKLYAYNRSNGLWHIEGEHLIVGGTVFRDTVYFATAEAVMSVSGGYGGEWSATLCDICENDIRHKGINDIFIRAENFENSEISVFVSVSGGEYVFCGKTDLPGDYTFRVPVRFRKGDKYSIKISGKGSSYIKDIQRSFYIGGTAATRKG